MSRKLQALKGSTDTLLTYPPFDDALDQPSAADVRIRTPDVALPAEGSEDAVTVDPVDTTLSAAADRGSTTVELTSVANAPVPGRLYLLLEADGTRHVVRLEGLVSTTATLAEPLLADVANGSAFKGIALTHALTTSETATKGPGLAVWRATIGGVQRRWDEAIRIVTAIFPLVLSPADLLRRKEVRRLRDSTDDGLTEVIEDAWENDLRVRLRARGIHEERINTPDAIKPAHIEAVLYQMMRSAGEPAEMLEMQERTLTRVIDDILASSKWWYDHEDEEAQPDEDDTSPDLTEVALLTR